MSMGLACLGEREFLGWPHEIEEKKKLGSDTCIGPEFPTQFFFSWSSVELKFFKPKGGPEMNVS